MSQEHEPMGAERVRDAAGNEVRMAGDEFLRPFEVPLQPVEPYAGGRSESAGVDLGDEDGPDLQDDGTVTTV